MIRRATAATIVAALALGLAGGWLLRGTPARTAGVPDTRGDSGESERVDALLSRIERLEAAQGRSSATSRPGDATGAMREAADALPQTPAQRDAQRAAIDQHFQDALAKAFAGQPASAANDARTARIDAALTDPAVLDAESLPVSEDVDCHAALCRVRARFAVGADGSDWVNRLLLAMGDVLPNASVTSSQAPDGSTEAIVYASRQGERPPVAWTQADPAR